MWNITECKACGHVHDCEKPSSRYPKEENQPFIEILGSFHRDTDGYYSSRVEVSLYACPICQTIRAKGL